MKEILEYLQQIWIQAGFPEIASYFAAIATLLGGISGITSLLWKLGAKFRKLRQQRKLKKDLHPFYTPVEIQRATQYYVETKCQNIPPSKEDEPRRTHAFATKEKTIPFFLKQAFKPEGDDCQFYRFFGNSRDQEC